MGDMDVGDGPKLEHGPPSTGEVTYYAGLSSHVALMMAHIGLMVLAWFFVLPLGVMFSIARSRYTLPVQLLFLVVNGVGVTLATIYNVSTPDLYVNNAHHKIGWIATWVMTAQAVMSLLFLYSGRTSKIEPMSSETAAFLPMSAANMAQHNHNSPYHDYRWSADSGSPTSRSSATLNSPRDISPSNMYRLSKELERDEDVDDEEGLSMPMPTAMPETSPSHSRFRVKVVDTFLSAKHGTDVFNGLAHFIKGGIFFWYGLLTLGRWMGCFASWGWAWQVKPSQSQVGKWNARMPSAEFTESFVIWLYGASNVFLEHLGAWGGQWDPQDFEHVSISIMFFGGGLLGMLVESTTIRSWLNTAVDMMPAGRSVDSDDKQQLYREPKTYGFSYNPVPALVIMLLGIMMSSHSQDSMVSTKVHGQWGTLLSGFAIARTLTYLFLYISPPTSIYPSRPPTELLSAFCLISGGLIFMASCRDIIRSMESRGIMAMFVFTVVMGFTSFLMAWTVVVIAFKGWAVRREAKCSPKH
ncbi:uncharacterized protein AB675_8255 [Cyphellophora attinorum]|uniref:Putative membrane protein n=1 Tax=Cyphellophora attinorum TaxID=1664694 RepID=A0A0N1H9L4_9EURO|nr:uncharacterized protein AB675_8255 [Phialophora attinorum]KPI44393.1 putative membrane protein [Phialophora attinorum]